MKMNEYLGKWFSYHNNVATRQTRVFPCSAAVIFIIIIVIFILLCVISKPLKRSHVSTNVRGFIGSVD